MTPETSILFLTKDAEFQRPRDGGALRAAAVYARLRSEFGCVVPLAVRSSDRNALPASSGSSDAEVSAFRVWWAWIRVMVASLRLGSIYHVRAVSFSTIRRLLSALDRGISVAVIEWSYLQPYSVLIKCPIVYDFHNIESELRSNILESNRNGRRSPLKRLRDHIAVRGMISVERSIVASGSEIAVVSDHDRDALVALRRPRFADQIFVATNGVSDHCFEFEGPRERRVVFAGFLGWGPNADAAVWLATKVWPIVTRSRQDLQLLLTGRSPSSEIKGLESGNIRVVADPDDIVPFVGESWVATAPLLAAGGTRLKILEALACGTPVVATPMGALGLERLSGDSLIVAADETSFAESLLSVLDAEEVSRSHCRDKVENYRWETALDPLISRVRSHRVRG